MIAPNYGARRHPAWYPNPRANPEATIHLGGEQRRVLAREAEGERIWRPGLEVYPGWAGHERRAKERTKTGTGDPHPTAKQALDLR